MEYNPIKKEIKTNRILSNLDNLVIDFTKILEKFTEYVIISGYVSIILGRSRVTEDVDLYIKKISFEKYLELFSELDRKGFWCLNSDNPKIMFSYLEDGYAIRFAKKGKSIPNFEIKFPKRSVDIETFEDFITVLLKNNKIKISSLERQIAFKRYYLKSDKDKEDALHIEELFSDKLDNKKINKFKEIIDNIKD